MLIVLFALFVSCVIPLQAVKPNESDNPEASVRRLAKLPDVKHLVVTSLDSNQLMFRKSRVYGLGQTFYFLTSSHSLDSKTLDVIMAVSYRLLEGYSKTNPKDVYVKEFLWQTGNYVKNTETTAVLKFLRKKTTDEVIDMITDPDLVVSPSADRESVKEAKIDQPKTKAGQKRKRK